MARFRFGPLLGVYALSNFVIKDGREEGQCPRLKFPPQLEAIHRVMYHFTELEECC